MPAVDSSAITSVDYEARARRLRVTFVNGRTYAYDRVPPAVYAALMSAESKGAFFNRRIRDAYPTTLLSR
jgi:hypothetical protein